MCTEFAQPLYASRQPFDHLRHGIIVVRIVLHGARRALQVHQDVGHAQSRHGVKHGAVECAARDVVDEVHPVVSHAVLRHFGTEGVDRQASLRRFLSHDLEGSRQTPHFFVGTHLVGAGTRGISADVDEVGAFL